MITAIHMDHQFDGARCLNKRSQKFAYIVFIFAANKGEGAGKPHEMTQAQSNHTKKLPISSGTHIESYMLNSNYNHVLVTTRRESENRIVPEAFVL